MVSKWELEDSDATTQSGDASDDDLGYPRSTPKKWRHRMETSGGVSSSEQPGLGRKACSAKNPIAVSVNQEIISLSDDEFSDIKDFDDGAAAYEKFKNRKSLQRKQAAAITRRAKGVTQNPIVGKRPAKTETNTSSRKRQRQLKEYGELSSDDDMMGHILPNYIQNRRSAFDKKTVLLKEAGLKLPPNFDDVEFSDDEHLEDLKEKPDFQKATPSRNYEDIQLPYSLGLIPAPIAQWLRDYQVRGVEFLHELFVYQKGGILGDDMGLGKSVQVIAFLTAAYGKTGDERDAKRMRKMRRTGDGVWYPRTLIVCPGTLLQNWKSELDRWGWWHVEVYHGAGKEAALQSAASGRVEIMLTTYKTYVLNKGALNMVEWDCVVADECHIIKERKSETAQSMNEINALCRIGLTGTAIQNKYEELWTLLNWTNPGKFGPVSTWKSTICDPLKLGQSHDATMYQLSKARKTAKKLANNLLPPFFLRRMKTLIADQLPKKSDRVVFCPLTPTQADAYERVLDSDIIKYIKMSSDPCSCGSRKKSGWCCRMYLPQGGKWQSYVFPAISNLQKLSNHLAILIPQSQDPSEKQDKDLEMLQIAVPDQWRQLYATRDSILNYANHEFCGKWKVLKKLLKWWHGNGDKVLVFSHSVRLLKMLQMLFKHTSYNVSYLDGSMTYDNRAKAVDNFNADPREFVFLISTRAGGIGLNITSANKVVVVDPNWNPAFDLQAQDRAYRIGQSRDVEVFRLISAGTIEEIVYARQIYKQQQANIGYTASTERRYFKGIQEKKGRRGEIFGLSNMFQYQGDNIVLRDIVNKTNVAESKVGVKIVELELDDTNDGLNKEPFPSPNDEENDDAMSQLAAMIRGEEVGDRNENKMNVIQAKHDPIQAILAGAGVEYTHENSEVIGSSKIEERLSRRAEMAADGASFGEEQVFQGSQDDVSSGFDVTHGGKRVRFKYHPPEDVKRRQFCSMAKRFGFDSLTEFALVVEGMTQAQRRGYLTKWYRECQSILMSGTNTPVMEEDVSLLNSIPKQQTPG
ncbi:DNA excision repair protein (Rad26L) [Paracoccidioides lutzii Pb01]|uniref:DNA excision repair protein (Rad26L) n=1 Tax=Paracoccidioides lutzii (strain ATCC MYA-826 / Pb01) TaxID=502779 RepID=C1H4U6_PARBA|nr:DNA excision repair protein (Rad26L) [Paracoccidioides lutzii Pb01]EEH34740.1 DNA excision repair protein (Rad26L) [Paracoccidioides lutzii Pb01]